MSLTLGEKPLHAAEENKAAVPVLSADDYAEIEQLYARYMHDYSTASEDGKDFAALHTRDGMYVCPHCEGEGLIAFSGAEALAGYATGRVVLSPAPKDVGGNRVTVRVLPPNGGKSANNVDHVVTNTFIEPVPGGVVARTSFLSVDATGPNGVSHARGGGVFFDYLVKTQEGWRFQRQQYVFRGQPVPSSIAPQFRDSWLGRSLK